MEFLNMVVTSGGKREISHFMEHVNETSFALKVKWIEVDAVKDFVPFCDRVSRGFEETPHWIFVVTSDWAETTPVSRLIRYIFLTWQQSRLEKSDRYSEVSKMVFCGPFSGGSNDTHHGWEKNLPCYVKITVASRWRVSDDFMDRSVGPSWVRYCKRKELSCKDTMNVPNPKKEDEGTESVVPKNDEKEEGPAAAVPVPKKKEKGTGEVVSEEDVEVAQPPLRKKEFASRWKKGGGGGDESTTKKKT